MRREILVCLLMWGVVSAFAFSALGPEVFLRVRLLKFGEELPIYPLGQALAITEKPEKNLIKEPKYISEKPLYAKATLGEGENNRFTFVFDESGGTGKGYDRLYVDANDNGDLTDDKSYSATRYRGGIVFGPVRLLIRAGSETFPYMVRCVGWSRGESPEFRLSSAFYYEGEIVFGKKRHKIALVDFNTNGLFNDFFKNWPKEFDYGDILLVDWNEDGKFDNSVTSSEVCFLGKYLGLKGTYYTAEVSPDGSRLKLKKAQVPLGTVKTAHKYKEFYLMLSSEFGALRVQGKNGEAKLPAGSYSPVTWWVETKDSSGRNWRVTGASWAAPQKGQTFAVSEGKTTELQIGSPFQAKVTANVRGAEVEFGLEFTGPAGGRIVDVTVNNQRPPEPMLKIIDEKGNCIASLKFHYG